MKTNWMKQIVPLLLVGGCLVFAQDTVITQTDDVVDGLDLQAVGALFKESEDLAAFEKALNDPDTGVNNLDLDENGDVDFIRVVEEVADDTHLIILQVPLREDEFQDVATIEVERVDSETYHMQVRGNEDLYGPDYYVAPTVVHLHTWPIITRIYGPGYRPYRSFFYWGFYPRWWRPYRPVHGQVYHTRVVKYKTKPLFVVTRKSRITTVHKVHYRPRHSVLVKRRVVRRPATARPARRPVRR